MSESLNPLQCVLRRINQSIETANRPANCVQLIAVSKTWPASAIREIADQGQKQFGENYLQEALSKIVELADLALEWHFIGAIQSNKTRPIAENFDWVHTVDRLKIAQRLSEQRPVHLAPLNICIQINIDDEDSKSGIHPDELLSLASDINALKNIRLRGIMVIPQADSSPKQQHVSFHASQKLFNTLQQHYPEVDTLSMGMSSDLEIAILEGATMVRVGSALFGARSKK